MAQKVILLCLFAVGCISAQLQCQHERDELAAGRNCERACRTDGTCRKQNRECICDGRCGPVCLRKTCPNLAQPGNGSVVFDPSGRFIGSEATYSCDNGFEVVGNAARICQANQTWGGTPPICQKFTGPLITVTGGQCERNDQEIQNQNRRCMRQCERDSDCLRGRPCVCDDICGLSCIPIDRTNYCEDLSSDQTVRVRITPNRRSFGSIARYECRNGHNVVGGSNERKCLGSGQWSGDPLTCVPRVRCGQPPEVANSAHNGTKAYYIHGDTVLYRCNFGYYRSGYLPLTRCNRDEWSELQFQCSPKSCGDPGHVLNGRRIGASFVFLGNVEYECNPGYELRGLSRRYCQANQQWSGSLPTCHRKSCPDPGVPDDGFKIGSDYYYDRIVSYDCNTRYILEGQSSIRCQANATWSALRPTCRLIQCRRPEALRNGRSDADLEYYGQQGTIRFTCDQGYTLRGSSVITCNEREQWSPNPPLCLGQCRIPSCPSHGTWTLFNSYRMNCRSNTMVDPGTRLTYRCNSGYFKCQQTEPVCNDRVWEPDTQDLCVPLGCNFVTLLDTRLTASYTYSGPHECFHSTYHQRETVIKYSCHPGYKILDGDPRQATCQWTNWNPRQQPECVEVTCPYIPFPHGSVTYQQNGPFTSNRGHTATAHFRCIEGYTLEGHTLTCDNGIWNDTVPTCVEEPCYVASLERYNMDVQYEVPPGSNEITAGRKTAGTIANFICRQHGFEASQTKRCERGSWTGVDPVCLRIPCDHEPLNNGVVTYTLDGIDYQEPVHGVVRSFNCNPGYTVDDDEPSECDAGRWTRRLPGCNEKPCDENDLPIGDWVIEFNYPEGRDETAEVMKSPGTVATFICNVTGYEINGGDSRLCSSGQWVGPRMTCERSRCQMSQLEDGRLRYFENDDSRTTTPQHGDYRIATCNDGHSLEGTSRTQCLEGKWMDDLPTCQENPCSFLNQTEVPDYLQVTYTARGRANRNISSSEGSVPSRGTATFTCREEGFVLRGESYRTCRKGTWRGEFPECVIAHCSVETIENGGVTRGNGDPFTREASHGDSIRFTCEQGYTLTGNETSHCDTGEWNPGIPTCIEASCSAVENNGQYENMYYQGRRNPPGTSFPAYTQLEVECAEGRVIEGPRMSECRRGLWEPSIPLCVEAALCEEVPQEEGRTVAYTGNSGNQKQHKSNLTVTCEGRMVRFGQNTSTCLNGTWSPPVARCKENHALNKPAYQESRGFDGYANLAVDGNTNGFFLTGRSCSHTSSNARNHWWYVDLGSSILVTEVVIYNRQDNNHHTRLLNAKVRVGEHRSSHVIWNDLAGTVTDTEINPIRIEVNPAIEGRIVSVSEVPNGNPLTLCEVQVFGDLPACPNGCEVPQLEHGYFTNRPDDTILNPKDCVTSPPHIYAHCQEGWSLPGRSYYYTCHQSGEWRNPERVDLTCERCRSGQCLVPYIENGHVESNRDGTTLANGTCLGHSEYLRVVCDNGMQLNGSEYYQCIRGLIDTRNTDNVLSSCFRGRCQSGQCVVPYIENGHYSTTRDGDPVEEGTCLADRRFLYVVCNEGMQGHGSFFYQCHGGEWLNTNTDNILSYCSIVSNVQERRCPDPGQANLVETFVGSDYTPLSEQEIFREGDFITSRCRNSKRQKFRGSVTRFCEGGRWSGGPAECESTNFVFSVGNTVIQNVTENGTIIVYPVRGYVTINCHLNGLQGGIIMSYQGTSSVSVGGGLNRYSYRINNPSPSNSGRYRCESNGRSHSITVLFEAINCPPPSQPRNWDHNRVKANRDGDLGYIFTETLSLRCPGGYTSSNPIANQCTYHGTWTNMLQICIRN